MKWWQFFFLMAAAYLGPHTPPLFATGLGCVMVAAGILAVLRGD